MIQRIQSVYLFAAIVLTLCLFCFPYVEVLNGEITYATTTCYLSPSAIGLSKVVMMPLAIVTCLAVIICFITLFTFRNRTRQMKLTKISIYLQFLIFATMIAYIIGLSKALCADNLQFNLCFPMIFPIVNIILLVLAHRGIKKDDDLVKSADRLR